MPRRKSVPSLHVCSALATCRFVRNSVCPEACLLEPLSELDWKQKITNKVRAVRRIDKRCSAVAQFLKSKLPVRLLSDLANVHLPKLFCPADSSDGLDETFELVYTMCAFLKCSLLEVSFSELLAATNGVSESTGKYSLEVTRSLLFGIMTRPDFFVNLERLDLRRLEGFYGVMVQSFDQLIKAIAEHGKELVHLDLGSKLDEWSTISSFVPGKSDNGVFVGSVPCPKLETFKVYNAYEYPASTISDILLSHPLLSSLDCFQQNGAVFKELCDKLMGAPDVFGQWKSGLTHVDIEEGYTDGNSHTSVGDAVSRLNRFFPKVTSLQAICMDSNPLELIPLMSRLRQLKLILQLGRAGGSAMHSTVNLLTGHGRHLTTLSIASNSVTLSLLEAIDQGCPNLAHLSLTICELTGQGARGPDDFSLFRNLESVSLRIIEKFQDGIYLGICPSSLMAARICLENKRLLEKFTFQIDENKLWTDEFVSEWITHGWTPNLREVNLGCWHRSPGSLPLTDNALADLMTLPKICRIGELEFWSMEKSTFLSRRKALAAANVDLELVWVVQ